MGNNESETDEDKACTDKRQDTEPLSEKGSAASDICSNGQKVGHEEAHACRLKQQRLRQQTGKIRNRNRSECGNGTHDRVARNIGIRIQACQFPRQEPFRCRRINQSRKSPDDTDEIDHHDQKADRSVPLLQLLGFLDADLSQVGVRCKPVLFLNSRSR